MNNELFIARSIDELPKERGWYTVHSSFIEAWKLFFLDGEWWFDKTATESVKEERPDVIEGATWLSPITIEQLIAEHPEVVEKIFEAARENHPRSDGTKTKSIGIPYEYPTATDYIKSLKG